MSKGMLLKCAGSLHRRGSSPLLYKRLHRLAFNLKLFVVPIIPPVIILLTPLLYFSGLVNWLVHLLPAPLLYPLHWFLDFAGSHGCVFVGTFIGVAVALSLINKNGKEETC